jgi:hypothetical protein
VILPLAQAVGRIFWNISGSIEPIYFGALRNIHQ